MDYKLAKQLYKDGTFKSPIPITKANEKYLEYPPLSELIKACKTTIRLTVHDSRRIVEKIKGKGFGRKNWAVAEAVGVYVGRSKNLVRAEGKNSLIAMTKLYIKLNA